MARTTYQQLWKLAYVILLLALGLVGCGAEPPREPASVTTPPAGETTTILPVAPEAPVTLSPVEPPLTPTAAGLVETQTTEVEPATPMPSVEPSASTLLPLNATWVHVENDVLAAGTSGQAVALQEQAQPNSVGGVMATQDGSFIAFTENMPGRVGLVIIDMQSGERSFIEGAIWATFAPDGRAVAFLVSTGNQWQLRRRDLPVGKETTLAEGEASSFNVPMPLAWTEQGILVQEIILASDAPPQGLQLVDPATGTVQPLYDQDFLRAIQSPDGAKIALTVGMARIGESPRMGLAILDVNSGETQLVVPEGPMSIMQVRWSPDATRLAFTWAPDYAPFATDLTVVGVEGSDNQTLAFSEIGADGALRDLVWRDDVTLLLLGGEAGGELRLFTLPASNLVEEALAEQTTLGPLPRAGVAAIIYVPR